MAKIHFGDINGILEGTLFKDRVELSKKGIHRPNQAGIDGNGKEGVSSIVLNGGYVDDMDFGDEIIYTGHGGNKNNRQVADQSWDDTGNKGLLLSEMNALPVRVTRGARHKSEWSPVEGYRFAGLYSVVEHFQQRSKSNANFTVCRFRLVKQGAEHKLSAELTARGSKTPNRVLTSTLRIVRDTEVSRQVKKMYNFQCQICDTTIEVQGVRYAEAAHIKPLGRPHNGSDTPDNVLCLCPNHHVMLDKGVISIKQNFNLFGLTGELILHKNHLIASENLKYHREHIYTDLK